MSVPVNPQIFESMTSVGWSASDLTDRPSSKSSARGLARYLASLGLTRVALGYDMRPSSRAVLQRPSRRGSCPPGSM